MSGRQMRGAGRLRRPAVVGLLAVLAATAVAQLAPPAARPFAEVLDTPAAVSRRVPRVETTGVARAGNSLVAVGARGRILVSNDLGATWRQVASPVGADLVAVHFADERHGWIVGHDAVILATDDGGTRWTVQLDGRGAVDLLRGAYAAQPGAAATRASQDLERQLAQSADGRTLSLPFLDVWFADARTGYAVGAFNLAFRTVDGGHSWQPFDLQIPNPEGYHLNSVRGGPAGLFIAGEHGLVLRQDRAADRFVALGSPYAGSFFGVLPLEHEVLVYGLRGHAFVGDASGADWSAIDTGTTSSVVAGLADAGQGVLLLTQDGDTLRRGADGRFHAVRLKRTLPVEIAGAVAVGPDRIAITGLAGPQLASLAASAE